MLQPNVTEPDLAVDASAIKRCITVLCHFNALLSVDCKEYLFIPVFTISLVKALFQEYHCFGCYFFSNYFNFMIRFSLFCWHGCTVLDVTFLFSYAPEIRSDVMSEILSFNSWDCTTQQQLQDLVFRQLLWIILNN